MYIDVVSAKYINDYRIEVTFENGKSGIVDFRKFIQRGGVFARLSVLNDFKRFRVNTELGTITWDGEIDVAPETLYNEATGEPFPLWMDWSQAPSVPSVEPELSQEGESHNSECM